MSEPTTQPRFAQYRYVDVGVICLAMNSEASILYCNRTFARLLGCTPNDLIGRSLDAIAINNKPHSVNTQNFKRSTDTLGRKMGGGLPVRAIMQGGPNKDKQVLLNVYDIDKVDDGEQLYFVGYVRLSTRIERWIERLGTGRRYRRIYKPALRFLLAGKRRPWATGVLTTTAPIWLPRLINKFPAIAEVVQSLLGL
ncbi:MAG: PAS domain-containing protein [Cyanobacteria bacterium J06560_5]